MLKGQISVQDYIISKKVKLGSYKNPPPGAVIAENQIKIDPRAAPEWKERVPHVFYKDHSKNTLREQVISPNELLTSDTKKINAHYYISKQIIQPLNRILNLVGVGIIILSKWCTFLIF